MPCITLGRWTGHDRLALCAHHNGADRGRAVSASREGWPLLTKQERERAAGLRRVEDRRLERGEGEPRGLAVPRPACLTVDRPPGREPGPSPLPPCRRQETAAQRPYLVAFSGCLYFAGLRLGKTVAFTQADLDLPQLNTRLQRAGELRRTIVR